MLSWYYERGAGSSLFELPDPTARLALVGRGKT